MCVISPDWDEFCILVPAAVQNLLLSNAGTDELNVTWSPAPGDVDYYEVCFYKTFFKKYLVIHRQTPEHFSVQSESTGLNNQ